MAVVYISLGSNLGQRSENIERAYLELENRGIKIEKRSTVIETDPVGGPVQGKYLNSVIEVTTLLTPEKLLKELQGIETLMGRVRNVKDGPRIIDLDILLFDQLKFESPTLIIPHPRMFSRDFVLIPLKEIAPHLF